MNSLHARLAEIKTRAVVLSIIMVLLSILCAKLFWRRLCTSLDESKEAYLEAEKQINRLATRDVLTGLSNRYTVVKQFEMLKSQTEETGVTFSAMMLDLDKFKPINDQYGHLVGDMVLKEVASRISATLGPSNYCARYGGDEFVCLIPHSGQQTPEFIAQKITQEISKPMFVDGLKLEVGCSIGIAEFGDDCTGESELLRRADVALYEAKKTRNNTVITYELALEADQAKQQTLIPELRAAIASNVIEPFFQPIICLKTGSVRGLEILARWQHPERGQLLPSDFMEAAHTADLTSELTRSVLTKACMYARDFPKNISICLNLSPFEMQNEWLVEDVLSTISRSGIPAHRLEVEISESAVIEDPDRTRQIMVSLSNIGTLIALNDFGLGHSSLSLLPDLPVSKIKIDRKFISEMKSGNEGLKTVKSIIGLAKNLDVTTVAVGIENTAQRDLLKQLGCEEGQGFLFYKPLPAQELRKLFSEKESYASTEQPDSVAAPSMDRKQARNAVNKSQKNAAR